MSSSAHSAAGRTILPPALLLVAAAIVAQLALPAGASASDDKTRAAALFKQGRELERRGDLAGALERYRAAYEQYPSYKIDLNTGIVLQRLGRDPEAADAFERFLHKGRAVSPGHMVRQVANQLSRLRRKLGRLKVVTAT